MPRPKPRSSDRLSLKQIPVRGMGSTSLNGSKTHSVPLSTHAAALPIFASGIEFLTGLVPVFIEGDIPEARKDVFGLTHTNAKGEEVTRKPFPVPVVAA
jgi:hypothetical protein